MSESKQSIDIRKHYPLYISTEKHPKLLVIQSFPEEKIWFKGEPISMPDLIKKLEKI